MNKQEIKKLIDSIYINSANLEHITSTGKINGTLRSELERVIQEIIQSLTTEPQVDKVTAEEVMKRRIAYFRNRHHSYEAKKLEEALKVIKELVPPNEFANYDNSQLKTKSKIAENILSDIEILLCKLIGEASMCWDEEPKGKYDDKKAYKVLVDLKQTINDVLQTYATQSNAEAMREHAIGFGKHFTAFELDIVERAYNQYLTTLTK